MQSNGRWLFNKTSDDFTNIIQANGTISALAGTQPNQVVVNSQLPTSGTYTPTLTNVSNVSSSTLLSASYQKIGNIVTVRLSIAYTPTSTTAFANVSCTLPFNRATSSTSNMGSGFCLGAGTQTVAACQSISTTDVRLVGLSGTLSSSTMSCVFQYSILE
jgi:hypothetical protein